MIFFAEPCGPCTMNPSIRTLSSVPTGSRVETLATKPGVAVGIGVGVEVGVGVGGGPEISTLAENSEVLPAGSVAVEAIVWYPGLLSSEVAKEALPVPSVVRLAEPR
jgi:hypothetical protein